MSTPSPYSPVIAPPHIHALLSTLHATSLAQEASIPPGAPWNSPADDPLMLDKFIALDPQKCQFVYLLARYALATHVVEVGTSFGLSTMYLALAVGQNVAARAKAEGEGVVSGKGGKGGKVLATEKEPSKAGKAREHWRTAGETVEPWIELLEGDLLETVGPALARWEESVDLLLLDIWAPMALPALKIIRPHLRHGALVITDNTESVARYADFLAYIHEPANGFRTMTTPFSGGLEVSVYLPDEV